jgi:hypothetical protein
MAIMLLNGMATNNLFEMKIETNENGEIILKEVYLGVGLESDDKEFFKICMRDTGFEFNYNGDWYEAKQGELKVVERSEQFMCYEYDLNGKSKPCKEQCKKCHEYQLRANSA